MSSFVVHFPDGTKEFRYPARPLEEGDVLWHDGVRFRVIAIANDDERAVAVTVEPDIDDLGNLLRSEEGALRLVPAQ